MEKIKELIKYRQYRVNWVDSCGTPSGWISLEDIKYPTEVQNVVTLGTLINMSEESVVMAQSYIKGTDNIQEQAMGVVVIPIACINRIEEINVSSSCQGLVSTHLQQETY